MKIDIQSFARTPGAAASIMLESDDAARLFSGDMGRKLEAVSFEGELRHLENREFELSGLIRAVFKENCDRCLKSASKEFSIAVCERFVPRQTSAEDDADDCYGYAGHVIEIDQAIRDNLLPGLPIQLLCRDDCPGICPGCGRDLSEESCQCDSRVQETRYPFNQLKELLQDKE